MRLILTDQDLSGQTIEGQPFSYIGGERGCTGTDVKFTGDWTHLSYFHNNLIRPDFSQAQTRYSSGRFNTLVDVKVSPDVERLDQDMMLAMFEAVMPQLSAVEKKALGKVVETMRHRYLVSWNNLAPQFLKEMGGDFDEARRAISKIMGGREYIVKHYTNQARADATRTIWDDSEEPARNTEGVTTSGWGVVARNREGKEYRRHWSELPAPTNPHDRVEMAELIEAEILEAIGLKVSFYIHAILPWRAYTRVGTHPRDWLTQ